MPKLACMKPESLAIGGQDAAVNVFLSLARAARHAVTVGGVAVVTRKGAKCSRHSRLL